jgi:arylformamidase
LPNDIVKGAIAISGIYDLHPLRYSWLQPKLLLDHEIIRHQSPLFNLPDAGPPLLITLGEKESDEFHRQAAEYFDAWNKRGLSGQLYEQPGADHFGAIEGFADADSHFCRKLIDFIQKNGGSCENPR